MSHKSSYVTFDLLLNLKPCVSIGHCASVVTSLQVPRGWREGSPKEPRVFCWSFSQTIQSMPSKFGENLLYGVATERVLFV